MLNLTRTNLVAFCILSVTLTVNAQTFSKQWMPGSYYDTVDNQHTGLILYRAPGASLFKGKGHYLLFKRSKDSVEKKIQSDSIKAFVIGRDSFLVSHEKMLEKFPFVKVVIDNRIKLYNSFIISPGRTVYGMPEGAKGSSTYYFGLNADDITPITLDNFQDVMEKIMSDKPEIINKIRDKTFKYRNIKSLISYYLTGVSP